MSVPGAHIAYGRCHSCQDMHFLQLGELIQDAPIHQVGCCAHVLQPFLLQGTAGGMHRTRAYARRFPFTALPAKGSEVRTAPKMLYCQSFPKLGELTAAGVRIVSALFIPAAFEHAHQHNRLSALSGAGFTS
jgi:hypothetical protein